MLRFLPSMPDKPKNYTLTYSTAYGSAPNPVSLSVLVSSNLPVLICKGCVFAGWYYDEDHEDAAEVGDSITKNTTLYAKWEEGVQVDYDSRVLAIITAGQEATLACKGMKALTDIVVTFVAGGSIFYNGAETNVNAGKTATLACAGKKMITDIVLRARPLQT